MKGRVQQTLELVTTGNSLAQVNFDLAFLGKHSATIGTWKDTRRWLGHGHGGNVSLKNVHSELFVSQKGKKMKMRGPLADRNDLCAISGNFQSECKFLL